MHIVSKYKVRNVANENVILIQGGAAGDMSKVIALNSTSLFLWNELNGKEFDIDDVVRLLTNQFDVQEDVARKDASQWVDTFKTHGIIE